MAPCQQLLFMELETQFECDQLTSGPHYGTTGSGVWGTKLEIFLRKNQDTQRKLLNFEYWVNGEV